MKPSTQRGGSTAHASCLSLTCVYIRRLCSQIYTQLASVMSKVFFPGSNPAVQALSIWGIFAGEHANAGDTAATIRHMPGRAMATNIDRDCAYRAHQHCLSVCLPALCSAAPTVGFVSRPVGALIFGHMGDTRGRGLCLLISVILMGVPTVSQTHSCSCTRVLCIELLPLGVRMLMCVWCELKIYRLPHGCMGRFPHSQCLVCHSLSPAACLELPNS